jgi:hypothetical protein
MRWNLDRLARALSRVANHSPFQQFVCDLKQRERSPEATCESACEGAAEMNAAIFHDSSVRRRQGKTWSRSALGAAEPA